MNIAVMLSAYNGGQFVGKLIESILSQQLPSGMEMKLYVRDDGSKDNTKELLDSYCKLNNNVISVCGGG